MNFCILSYGFSNIWVVITSFITFSSVLIITAVSLITKATEKNKKPKAKRIILITTFLSFFLTMIFFTLVTRSLFIYEISQEDYADIKTYLKDTNKEDVIIYRISSKIVLCKRKNISDEMKEIIIEAKESGYVTYEDLICFSKKSCKK